MISKALIYYVDARKLTKLRDAALARYFASLNAFKSPMSDDHLVAAANAAILS